jgi:hypothetical protein
LELTNDNDHFDPPRATEDDPTSLIPKKLARSRPLFDPEILGAPRRIVRQAEPGHADEEPGDVRGGSGRRADHRVPGSRHLSPARTTSAFELQIALWLWFTVLFANFAEAMAEARGKAQADTLRKTKTDALANRVRSTGARSSRSRSQLRSGDVVICERRRPDPRRWRSHRRHRHGR